VSTIAALIGSSTVIRHVQHLISKVAENDSPILLTGEPGTGKESLARVVHEKSSRASGPFVPVKCASMGDDTLQIEILGEMTERGFRPGRIAAAEGGTLFLDDVIKLSTALQARIVALLQEGCYIPIGGTEQVRCNVRVICSTGVQIDQSVREGKFREDLYYRLAGCAIYVPPLRDRREDIALLTEHFIQRGTKEKGKRSMSVAPDAMTALLQHSWDHNIKELENLVERIVVLKNGGNIEVSDLPPRLRKLVTDDIDNFYQTTGMPRPEGSPPPSPSSPPASPQGRPTSHLNKPLMRPPSSGAMGMGTAGAQGGPSASMGRMDQGFAQGNSNSLHLNRKANMMPGMHQSPGFGGGNMPPPYDESSEIDQFIRKDIDLAGGIDFYRVVEEFENRLIAEALRRTNHNKNRAAQLLSMNRTTLVEKLKKRAASSTVKIETGRVKRNPAFTIFDGLGSEAREFDTFDFIKDNSVLDPNND
jgi:sigma-54 specific flagellar transcriptional regulator A